MRLLGLDLGEKRIGVALSDPLGVLASPLTVIERRGERADIQAVLDLARQHQAEGIVVGLPRSLDGSIGSQARKALDFCSRLATRSGVPLVTWDERFSTVEAERALRDAAAGPARRKRQRDAVAAAIILQAYLDAHSEGLGPTACPPEDLTG